MFSVQQLTDDVRLDLHWQMTNCERYALQGLLERLSIPLAIEIGTYRGGSLQVLSKYSEKVVSIDIDPEVARRLDGKFPNVEYLAGDSTIILPELVEKLNRDETPVGFILIDGDHSTDGVRRDIEFVLELIPTQRTVILMHDSFNPACREGMRIARWSESPYVSWVELDFIPGIFHEKAHDTAEDRSMWGGFACAVMDPNKRQGSLQIQESQSGLYEAVYRVSEHCVQQQQFLCKMKSLVRRIRKRL